MAKKPSAKSKKKTKPGVPGEAGNKDHKQRRRGAKAAEQEQVPGMGHNGPPKNGPPTLSAKERRALLSQHVELYKAKLERKKAADADLKNACKLIKAEGGKQQVARVKTSIILETPEGEATIREEIANTIEIAKWAGSAIGTQFSMNFEEPDRTPGVDRAYNEGVNAGMRGEPAKPPHDPSVPQYASWLDGWHSGQGELIKQNVKRTERAQEQEPAQPQPEPPIPPTSSASGANGGNEAEA